MQTKLNGAPEVKDSRPNVTKEQVIEWVRKDFIAAHYFLGVIIKEFPECMTLVADKMYDDIMRSPGARIDQVGNNFFDDVRTKVKDFENTKPH